MPMIDPLQEIKSHLDEAEAPDFPQYQFRDVVLVDVAARLAELDQKSAVKVLRDCFLSHPDSAGSFLWAAGRAARDLPDIGMHLLALATYWEDRNQSTELGALNAASLQELLPVLTPVQRSLVLFCYPDIQPLIAWRQGEDYECIGYDPASVTLPEELLEGDSVAARRQWLELVGYAVEDSPNVWGIGSRAALLHLQFYHQLDGTGEIDEATRELLETEAICAFYGND